MKYRVASDNCVNSFSAFRAPSRCHREFFRGNSAYSPYHCPLPLTRAHTKIRGITRVDSSTSVIEGRESERAEGVAVKGTCRERGPSVRTTHVRVSACNLMISSRNFDDAESAGRGPAKEGDRRERKRIRGELHGGEGDERRNGRPEERTSQRAVASWSGLTRFRSRIPMRRTER